MDESVADLREALQEALTALRLGRMMREAQRDYFRARSTQALVSSKNLEKSFDGAAAPAISRGEAALHRSAQE